VAALHNLLVQLPVLVLLGGLISVCAILVNHMIEWMHFSKLWYVVEVEEKSTKNDSQKKKGRGSP
jgi:hypothetical protein